MTSENIRLTQFSHGAGCGCKIAPNVLSEILKNSADLGQGTAFPSLLVGHHTRDDAAAIVLDQTRALLSTTDFFMPIVDDPYDFGRIAATNAISDIFAMGGTPVLAIAILGWPVNLLGPDLANRVVQGGRDVCQQLGFPLAGGHSIDAPEPIFGLAVSGIVDRAHLKQNSTAQAGDHLLLTKPLGIGIHTTAEKQGKLQVQHHGLATEIMCQANSIGAVLAQIEGVHALTDVTGFGLAGHLIEMCEAAGLDGFVDLQSLPILPALSEYIALGCVPGGSRRNYEALETSLPTLSIEEQTLLCDPQTSGGLLVAASPESLPKVRETLRAQGLHNEVVGGFSVSTSASPQIVLKPTQ
ncbi:MAG: selenide, water dikinase SelD [Luminiphilus sp.]|jgi:selenide, water dikinase|nr:selenide, water dikinase SelD [Luminiphilus sp.]